MLVLPPLGHTGLLGDPVVLMDLAVSPAAPRQGVGSRLAHAFAEELPAKIVSEIELEIGVDNTAALALLDRLGWPTTIREVGAGAVRQRYRIPLTGV